MFKRILNLLLLTFLCSSVYGNKLKTTISTDSLMIGDKIKLKIETVIPANADITDNTESIFKEKIHLLDKNVARIKSGSLDSMIFEYEITTFDFDTLTIPPISYYIKLDSLMDTLKSEALPLKLLSAIKAEEGDTIYLKDIREPLKAGKPSLLWLQIILATALLAGVLYFLYKKFRKEKKEKLPPPLPPYDEAIRALKELDKKELIEKGKRREFIFELSEILKRYAGRIYEVNFPEFTTEEILEWIDKTAIIKEASDRLKKFFGETHMIKFAKYIPDITTSRELRKSAVDFIQLTKPTETVSPGGKK